MHDRWIVTFKTERGEFRVWDSYRDRSLSIAREFMNMGALGVEVYDGKKERVIYQKGVSTCPA
jgi:hypothetical protein